MSKINDGGPAFPRPYLVFATTSGFPVDATIPQDIPPGMSLRDHFATHAPVLTGDNMAALLGWPLDLPIGELGEDEFVDSVYARWKNLTLKERADAEAKWSYTYADSMIAQRSKS